MKRLHHPNLLRLLGVCSAAAPYCAVLEYMEGGSLEDWLADAEVHPTPRELLFIVHQVWRSLQGAGETAGGGWPCS